MNQQLNHDWAIDHVASATDDLPCLDIIGIDVVDLTEAEALELAHDRIAAKHHTRLGFLNANNANIAKAQPDFAAALKSFVLLSDGIGVDIAAKVLHGNMFKANLNGTDLIPALLASARAPLKVGLYGGKPGVADDAAANFVSINPKNDVRVIGHGYIDVDDQTEMLDALAKWQPDILLVALGVPRQELWIAENLTSKHCTLAFGVGALFDFAAGRVPRAPDWARKLRMEWVYRLASEPKRLAKRYLLGNPLFLLHLARYKLTGASRRKNEHP